MGPGGWGPGDEVRGWGLGDKVGGWGLGDEAQGMRLGDRAWEMGPGCCPVGMYSPEGSKCEEPELCAAGNPCAYPLQHHHPPHSGTKHTQPQGPRPPVP